MPIDLEMILSASPPIFSTPSFMDFGYGHFHNTANRSPFYDHHGIHKTQQEDSVEDRHDGAKKRVWFADDKGLALTHVKVMSEPSNCPPRWTDEFLSHILNGVNPSPTSEVQWVVQFAQPASDYLAFRDKLQKKCVSLENVIVREGDDTVTGTIKVKNLAFDKEVFVRATFDKWKSSSDIAAIFSPSGAQTSGSAQYDTFAFSMCVPSSAVKVGKIEFCVCFRCQSTEYWDNNEGSNYILSAVSPKSQASVQAGLSKKVTDTLQVDIHAWSEFASWNHLITEGPYW